MTLYTNFVHLEERVEAAMIKNFHQPLGLLEAEAKKRVFCVCVCVRARERAHVDVVIQEAVFECNSKFMSDDLRVRLVGGIEKWEDGKLCEDRKYLVFPFVFLIEGV